MNSLLSSAAAPLVFGRDVKRILSTPTPSHLKRRLIANHAELRARELFGDDRPIAKILDFEVRAHRFSTLCYLFREIFVEHQYGFVAGPRPVIVDAGSNIGMSILFFKALHPDAVITGFEPGAAFEKLAENVARNRLRDVVVYPFALGDNDGDVAFFEDPDRLDSLTMSTVASRMNKAQRQVRQVRLSPYINQRVDLLKMDIEGAEQSVLDELVQSGAIGRVQQMIIEYHHHIDLSSDEFSRFLRTLETSGFGYHLTATTPSEVRGARAPAFQDVLIHAYRK